MINQKTGTVLLVDDEKGLLDILVAILQDLNINVHTAENGQAALEIIKTKDIDAVVSDINMPIMSGLDLLKELRYAGWDFPFVILTSYGERPNVVNAMRSRVTDFIEKPFEPHLVREVVKKAVVLGLSIKLAEKEIEKSLLASNMSEPERQRLREIQKSILQLKMNWDWSQTVKETA